MTTNEAKVQEWEAINRKLALYREEAPKANLRAILEAMTTLTDIEFRMWLNACEKFGSFDPSHFKGQEEQFIRTGTWDWVPVEGGK